MRKALKIAFLVLAGAVVVIQFFRPTFSNPPIVPGQAIEESMNVPADVQMVLARSCNDCHSNKTAHPWYTQIAPVSWWLSDHITEGRGELNFSEWNTYSAKKKAHKLEEICEHIESGAMPLSSYLWVHGDAALTPDQSRMLCDWAKAERAKIAVE
ncbi:MAG: heme-binding domain-containing protein [Acidobacteria bacterium]|nr:heme-binding domain-containing protein [Acidobacteriota bacterium]